MLGLRNVRRNLYVIETSKAPGLHSPNANSLRGLEDGRCGDHLWLLLTGADACDCNINLMRIPYILGGQREDY